ncbi:Ff.00g064620.m01.CDS01 [Fusarium sp. VM40]|nr:Ff.00g064620.m01.CDS01 [Fusarium sp. VM40]
MITCHPCQSNPSLTTVIRKVIIHPILSSFMVFFQKFKSIETLMPSMVSAFLVKDLDFRGELLYWELFEPGFGIGLPGWCFGRFIRGTQEVDASVVILWLDLVMLSHSGSNLDSGLFDNLFDDHRGNHAARRVGVPRIEDSSSRVSTPGNDSVGSLTRHCDGRSERYWNTMEGAVRRGPQLEAYYLRAENGRLEVRVLINGKPAEEFPPPVESCLNSDIGTDEVPIVHRFIESQSGQRYSIEVTVHPNFVFTNGHNPVKFLADIDGTITLSCHINDFEVQESGGRTTTLTHKLNGKRSGMNLVFQDLQTTSHETNEANLDRLGSLGTIFVGVYQAISYQKSCTASTSSTTTISAAAGRDDSPEIAYKALTFDDQDQTHGTSLVPPEPAMKATIVEHAMKSTTTHTKMMACIGEEFSRPETSSVALNSQ